MSKTFTTQAGATYSYDVEAGENGETVYNLSRIFQEGAMPIGAIAIHPNYELSPATPGLLNVQFGKGSVDRHERTDVPLLGIQQYTPYVVGHHLVNPADLEIDPESEKPVTDPKIIFRKPVRAAQTGTGSHSTRADVETFTKVQDLVTALVKEYKADKSTPKREALYAKFLDGQRAEVIKPKLDAIDAQIKALQIQRAELLEQLSSYKAA